MSVPGAVGQGSASPAGPLYLTGGKINGSNPSLILVSAQGERVTLEGRRKCGRVAAFCQDLAERAS